MGQDTKRTVALLAASGLGAGLLTRARRGADLAGEVAVITGGSRGLGLLLAREFARAGCKIVICARDAAELARAREEIAREGVDVLAVPCDLTRRAEAEDLIATATRHFGQVDILVNNAGIIAVGPVEAMGVEDFAQAMDIIFWGTLYPTLAVLPQMRARRGGRIVNITSIGGKVAVPHLLPYSAAKFATTGFSEGLHAELHADGITVTTVAPGELRTGSYVNVPFKGDVEGEFRWFSIGDNLPFNSMDAERAARAIVRATKRGEAERILTVPAVVATRVHGLFPGLTADLLALADRALPKADGGATKTVPGREIETHQPPLIQKLLGWGQSAARRFNETPAPRDATRQE